MICIYHSRDLDGFCSAAIVKHKYPDCKLIGYDYGEAVPWDLIGDDVSIIMVDVSFPMEDMHELLSKGELIFIDHHIGKMIDFIKYFELPDLKEQINNKQLIDFYRHFEGMPLRAYMQEGKSACELTWEYFFHNTITPYGIKLLGRYDTFRQSEGDWLNETLPYQYGMRLVATSPETIPDALFNGKIPEVKAGKIVLQYQSQLNARNAKYAFEKNLLGYKAICINGSEFNSLAFDTVYDPDKHDIMVVFRFENGKWKFSIYTTHPEIDCSSIAKQFDGNGHRAAAGMQLLKNTFNNWII